MRSTVTTTRLPKHSIQVAGIRSAAEALLLEDLGVDLLGFPLRLDYHAPDISETTARRIISLLHHPERAVLITYLMRARDIQDLAGYLPVSFVQLHGSIPPHEVQLLKTMAPHLILTKSLIVHSNSTTDELLTYARLYEQYVDGFITDTFDPSTGASGATGRLHDWSTSRQLCESLSKPLFLAGGLRPSNVCDAITAVRPFGVDTHTGVETPDGLKSPDLVADFVCAARRAFNAM